MAVRFGYYMEEGERVYCVDFHPGKGMAKFIGQSYVNDGADDVPIRGFRFVHVKVPGVPDDQADACSSTQLLPKDGCLPLSYAIIPVGHAITVEVTSYDDVIRFRIEFDDDEKLWDTRQMQ